jgi:glycosyltransferase involved in cell wall biosynthesis
VGGLDFDSDYTAKAQQLVRQLGLSDSVRFLGPLQEAELVEVLRTSHVLCMPYAYEGFGIAILEAMAFGLPGIGCQNGAAGETISHGVNGFLLAKGDLAGLEPLLIQMHKDRETLLQMALAARATYLGHPTWQESIAAIDNFLQGLVDLRNQKKLFSPVRKPETSEPRNSDATR